jgi:hypothetical protein
MKLDKILIICSALLLAACNRSKNPEKPITIEKLKPIFVEGLRIADLVNDYQIYKESDYDGAVLKAGAVGRKQLMSSDHGKILIIQFMADSSRVSNSVAIIENPSDGTLPQACVGHVSCPVVGLFNPNATRGSLAIHIPEDMTKIPKFKMKGLSGEVIFDNSVIIDPNDVPIPRPAEPLVVGPIETDPLTIIK